MSAITSIFGGGSSKPQQNTPPPSPSVDQEPAGGEDKKKRLVRALLLGTASPEGDLSPVSVGRRKLLGN